MKKYVCGICGYIYEEALGIPKDNITPATKWDELPAGWVCPLCGAPKSVFEEQKESINQNSSENSSELGHETNNENDSEEEALRELSLAQMSALCSNFAKGCEKQYLMEESQLFMELSEYYRKKAGNVLNPDMEQLLSSIERDLSHDYIQANNSAKIGPDRGALRSLVWSEKVTRILESLLKRYESEGNSLLQGTDVYVCEICGFLYIGNNPPKICPICKVPNIKLTKIEGR